MERKKTAQDHIALSHDLVVRLLAEGLSQTKIANQIGATQQNLQYYIRRKQIPHNTSTIPPHGPASANWKTGRKRHNLGYIFLRIYGHPYKSKCGWVLEHRVVMEEMIGRYLHPKEVVHHKNGIKDDNRPDNLELMPSLSHHAAHHGRIAYREGKLKILHAPREPIPGSLETDDDTQPRLFQAW